MLVSFLQFPEWERVGCAGIRYPNLKCKPAGFVRGNGRTYVCVRAPGVSGLPPSRAEPGIVAVFVPDEFRDSKSDGSATGISNVAIRHRPRNNERKRSLKTDGRDRAPFFTRSTIAKGRRTSLPVPQYSLSRICVFAYVNLFKSR